MSSNITKSANGVLLVDRQDSIDLLNRLACRVADEQRPRYAFIYGDSGIGKTAIMEHFLSLHSDRKGSRTLVVSVRPVGGIRQPLFPFADAIADFQKRYKNTANTVMQLASNFLLCIPSYGSALKGIADVLLNSRHLSEMDRPETSQHAIFSNYSNMLEAMSKNRMLMLCIDDAHKLDETSMDLLEYLVHKNKRTGILFVIAARRPGADGNERRMLDALDRIQHDVRERAERIEVGPMPENFFGALIKHFAVDADTQSEYVHRLHALTGGNPYWLSSTMEHGAEQAQVPPRIAHILEKRLDEAWAALPGSQEVLQHAAVLGFRFDISTLADLLGIEATKIFDMLSTLERRYRLVRQSVNREYTFDHNNTHEFIYDRLGPVLADYHRKVAELLERGNGSQPDLYRLAYHYSFTGCKEKALQYMEAAATASASCNLFTDAANKLERCISIAKELGKGDSEIIQLRADYAHSLLEENEVGRSMEVLEGLIRSAYLPIETKARCHTLLSRCHRLIGTDESGGLALDHARQAANLMQGTDTRQAGDAYAYLATVCDHFLADVSETRLAYRRAIRCYRGHPQSLARLSRKAGMVMQPRRAIISMESALQTFERCKMNIEKARCLNNLGAECLYMGSFQESFSYLSRSLEEFRKLGTHEIDIPLNNLGLCHLQNGKYEKAVKHFDEALGRASEPYNEAAIKINLSTAQRKQVDAHRALEILSEVEDHVMNVAEPTLRDYYGFNRGIAHQKLGEWDAAIEWLTKFPVNTYKNDQELAWAKRWSALSETYRMRGGGQGIGEAAEEKVARIFSTERPQRWFYEEDYYPCDIHIWD